MHEQLAAKEDMQVAKTRHCSTYILLFYSPSLPVSALTLARTRQAPVLEPQPDCWAAATWQNLMIQLGQPAKTPAIQRLRVSSMIGRVVLVLVVVAPKLVLVTIASCMTRLLVMVVGLVGILWQPRMVRIVPMTMLVAAIHAVPVLAIPTAAVIIAIAGPVRCITVWLSASCPCCNEAAKLLQACCSSSVFATASRGQESRACYTNETGQNSCNSAWLTPCPAHMPRPSQRLAIVWGKEHIYRLKQSL